MNTSFKLTHLPKLLSETGKNWIKNDPFGQSAAVAFYAILSMPGLTMIVISIAGYFLGDEAVSGKLSGQIASLIGKSSAEDIQSLIAKATFDDKTTFQTIMGIGSLIFGATGVFARFQMSLNATWQVQQKSSAGILKMIKDRLISLGLVVSIGFLLLISLSLTTIMSALSEWITSHLPIFLVFLSWILDITLSLGIITLLFASIYKVLPDVEMKWSMVWRGAFMTALLFTLGKYGIGLYLSKSDPGSAFGAAGSVVLILLWVSYSAMIVFFGAEFTQVYGRRYGFDIVPSSHAEYTPEYVLDNLSKERSCEVSVEEDNRNQTKRPTQGSW